MKKNHPARTERRGFTLIELLVVMGILVALLALGVMIVPAFKSSSAELGATQLQGWLHIAKQRALRDQAPRGLRLFIEPTNGSNNHLVVRRAQYIEVPPDYRKGRATIPAGSEVCVFSQDISGGLGGNKNVWPVQAGDYIQVANGPVRRILEVVDGGRARVFPVPSSREDSEDYRIMRHPRPIRGEEVLTLPTNVIVDLAQRPNSGQSYQQFSQYLAHEDHIDILFSPSGEVQTQGPLGKVILAIRSIEEDRRTASDQTLITVYCRTGLIAAHPVNLESNDRFLYTRDVTASGL